MPRATRQRQTRLTFTPLPSSSPATNGYNKQIKDRAAAVTLSSVKRSPRAGTRAETAFLTPASQDEAEVDAKDNGTSDSEPVRPSHLPQRKSSRVKRGPKQRQIDFTNARDPASFSPPMTLSSSSTRTPRSATTSGMFATRPRNKAIVDISSDIESDDDELPSVHKLVRQRATCGDSKPDEKLRSEHTRNESEEEEEDNTIIVKSKSSPILVESDDDEDDMPTTAGVIRRKRVARRSSPDRDSFIASSPSQISADSDSDLEIVEPPSRKRRRIQRDSQDEDESHTPVKRRLKSMRKLSRREQNELDEDLDFLGPSSDVEALTRNAPGSQSAIKNARQKALEALKRKRSGAQHGQNGTDSESTADVFDDQEDLVDHIEATRSSQMFQEEDDDKAFIASDDNADADDMLGEPEGMPLMFTNYASMKPKELFKYAVEWFVQKKMNPAFQMDDEIYKLTFRKLDDEVSGLAGSKFTSSAWKDEFVYTLKARPDIAFAGIDRSEPGHAMRDTCDACNRTGHPPTYQVQFLGRPYHRQTLEELAGNTEDDEDDSDSRSDNSNEPNWDADGHEIPPETNSWFIGKFCMSNARTAHALQHWRYHLNTWVIGWLDSHGYNTAEQVLKRESLGTQKRRKYANKIADQMEQQGVVKLLYREYRSNIDDARSSKQGRYASGWE